MKRVLVTGGTGVLGKGVVSRLQESHIVRVMSHRPGSQKGVEWARADLLSGVGLKEAVRGTDMVVHAASSPQRETYQVDVLGTKKLLEEAKQAGVGQFFYISIVGIDRIPYAYYRHKLAAEQLVKQSGLAWSILRATQFHTLLDMLLVSLTRFPIALIPTDLKFQPVDPGEVAGHLVAHLEQQGYLPEFAGPEILSLGAMTKSWLEAKGLRPVVWHLPLPGARARAFREGHNTNPQAIKGSTTWQAWLLKRYMR